MLSQDCSALIFAAFYGGVALTPIYTLRFLLSTLQNAPSPFLKNEHDTDPETLTAILTLWVWAISGGAAMSWALPVEPFIFIPTTRKLLTIVAIRGGAGAGALLCPGEGSLKFNQVKWGLANL